MNDKAVNALAKYLQSQGAQAKREGFSIRDCPFTAANMQIWHLEQWKDGYLAESRRIEAQEAA